MQKQSSHATWKWRKQCRSSASPRRQRRSRRRARRASEPRGHRHRPRRRPQQQAAPQACRRRRRRWWLPPCKLRWGGAAVRAGSCVLMRAFAVRQPDTLCASAYQKCAQHSACHAWCRNHPQSIPPSELHNPRSIRPPHTTSLHHTVPDVGAQLVFHLSHETGEVRGIRRQDRHLSRRGAGSNSACGRSHCPSGRTSRTGGRSRLGASVGLSACAA